MSRAPYTTSFMTSATLGLLASVALTAPLAAQEPPTTAPETARLQGVVVLESTFEPVPAAMVTLVDTEIETQTGSLGQFAIAAPPVGTVWVRVTAPGLPTVREQVEIGEEGIIFLQFRMPDDVSAFLDEVLVSVPAFGQGAEGEARTALDLLAIKVPSVRMRQAGYVGQTDGSLRLRGVSSFTQSGDPLLVIDDVVARGAAPLDVLSQMPASDVAEIEVLRGPTAAFLYPYAANGVIRVTTRRR